LEYSLRFNILFGIALSPILSTCPNHFVLCDLINLTVICLNLLKSTRK
jgi:hypothetical protein